MRCLTELTEQTELPGRGVLLACRSALGLVAQKAVAPLAAPASLWLADASRFAAKTNQRVLVCGERSGKILKGLSNESRRFVVRDLALVGWQGSRAHISEYI
jgi:hypothetical protein